MTKRVYVQFRDFEKALNADVVKKARARGTTPSWLKSFAGQLEDPEYVSLSLAERGFLHDLRLLALRRGNKILVDEKYLRGQLRITNRALCVPKVSRLCALSFLEPYDEATNDAANQILPSRTNLETGENESRLEGEVELEDPPTPLEGGRSTTSQRQRRRPADDPAAPTSTCPYCGPIPGGPRTLAEHMHVSHGEAA